MATESEKPNTSHAENPNLSSATEPQLNSAAEQQPPESKQPLFSEGAGPDAVKKDAEDSKSKGPAGISQVVANATLPADVQKKVKRVERFGVPVKLSEEEKRNTRAERFGTGSGVESKGAEDQKRKARAERFGLAVESTADEEAKKKARLERFAPVTKVDSQEEEKRKARAQRFSEPCNASNVNGKGNVESNTAIAGQAGAEA